MAGESSPPSKETIFNNLGGSDLANRLPPVSRSFTGEGQRGSSLRTPIRPAASSFAGSAHDALQSSFVVGRNSSQVATSSRIGFDQQRDPFADDQRVVSSFGVDKEPTSPVAASYAPWHNMAQQAQRTTTNRGAIVNMLLQMLQQLRSRKRQYTLQRISTSPFLLFLRGWHSIGLWLAISAIVIFGCNLLLSWYIDWFRKSKAMGDQSIMAFPAATFLAIFLRSWLLACVTGELARFAFVLCKDVWAADSFETYRQAVCGELYFQTKEALEEKAALMRMGDDGKKEWEARKAQPWRKRVWKEAILISRRRWVDLVFQCCIYISFDLIPFLAFLIGSLESFGRGVTNCVVAVTGAALAHSLIFLVAWDATDARLKVDGFWQAYKGDGALGPQRLDDDNVAYAAGVGDRALENMARARNLSGGSGDDVFGPWAREGIERGVSHTESITQTDEESRQSAFTMQTGNELQPTMGAAFPFAPESQLGNRGTPREPVVDGDTRSPADKLNVCVALCGFLAGIHSELAYHLMWLFMFIFGCLIGNWGVIVGTLVVGAMFCFRYTRIELATVRSCPAWFKGDSWRLWSFQAWGETHCRLRYAEQVQADATFGVVVLLQGVIFCVVHYWAGFILCLFGVLLVGLRLYLVFYERPWGWLLGLVESGLISFVILVLNLWFDKSRWAAMCFLMLVLRQFGLARQNARGFQVARGITVLMNFMLVIVVSAVALNTTANEHSDYSYTCTDGKDGCHYEPIAESPAAVAQSRNGLLCQARFDMGANVPSFSISDFALMSALAYESEKYMDAALEHFFPGWEVNYARRVTWKTNDVDWTTFFEFVDKSNSTSVFAVRGTDSALDVLNDINIWAPAALMQGFSAFGPTIGSYIATGIAYLSTGLFSDNWDGFQKSYYKELRKKVVERVRASSKDRAIYITGHSLGGGLAKIVAAQAGIQSVTFMSPGLGITQYVVEGNKESDSSRYHDVQHSGFTVIPDMDVVSRVDSQLGVTIPARCTGGGMGPCHSVFPLLCVIYKECGSGRKVNSSGGKQSNAKVTEWDTPVKLPSHDSAGKENCPNNFPTEEK